MDVRAYAESPGSWEDVSRRFAAALEAAAAEWRPAFDYLDRPLAASVDLGCADPITVTMSEGLLVAQARTSPWGPGYHQRVTDVLEVLGAALPSGWTRVEDDANYWEARVEAELRAAFLRWALSLWSMAPAMAALEGVSVCLGPDEGPADIPPGCVATPTGFKGQAWIARTRQALEAALSDPDRELDRDARSAFLWWHREPDGFDWSQLGRAICTTDVIWRDLPEGACDVDQEAVRRRALACFEAARRADATAPIPLREMARLYELVGRAAEAAALVAAVDGGAVEEPFAGGYREGWLRCLLGGWTFQVPGWLQAGVDGHDGHDVFWGDGMTVHLTVLNAPRAFVPDEEVDRHLARLEPDERGRARLVDLENGAARGYAVVIPYGAEAPASRTLIQGQVGGHNGERVGFTVVARSPEACDAALRLGRSIRPRAAAGVQRVGLGGS